MPDTLGTSSEIAASKNRRLARMGAIRGSIGNAGTVTFPPENEES